MIMVVSDTHCYYEIVNKQIDYAENTLGYKISSVIHLGDFGIYGSHLKDFFIKQKGRFLRPVFMIDGNHEDFKNLHKLVERYKEFFTYLPRASVHRIEGYNFLALGGAAYMDSLITERESVITDQQIDSCLAIPSEAVDIVITHDCPVDIGVPSAPGMEHFGQPGFPRSSEISSHFKPRLWFFGHHHEWYYYSDYHTRYYGVCGVWKGFGILDENFNFTMVSNSIDWETPSLLDRILMRLRIIKPVSSEYD